MEGGDASAAILDEEIRVGKTALKVSRTASGVHGMVGRVSGGGHSCLARPPTNFHASLRDELLLQDTLLLGDG